MEIGLIKLLGIFRNKLRSPFKFYSTLTNDL
jgi:hypothetical protein